MNVEQAVKQFLVSLEISGLSKNSIRSYRYDVKHFRSSVKKNLSLNEISVDMVNKFLKNFKAGHSESSVNRMKSSLTKFFRYLHHAGHFKNPFLMEPLHHDRVIAPAPEPITEKDRETLWDAFQDRKDLRLLLVFYLELGLRLSEALLLNVNDVRNVESIRVVGKGKKVRFLEMVPKFLILIDEWIAERENLVSKMNKNRNSRRKKSISHEALFISYTGRRLSERGAQFLFQEKFKKVGFEHLTIHKLRHGCGKKLLGLGIDLRTIQTILGHERINTTQIYTNVTREDVKRALKKSSEDI